MRPLLVQGRTQRLWATWKKVKRIRGWLPLIEMFGLYLTASQCNDILEIGSYQGRSTVVLATACRGKVYAVDPHLGATGEPGVEFGKSTLGSFTRNLQEAGVQSKVNIVLGYSHDVFHKLCGRLYGMIFIDAHHTYEAVRRDTVLLWPLLKLGGHLCLHDMRPDQPCFVDMLQWREELLESRSFDHAAQFESLLILRKADLRLVV